MKSKLAALFFCLVYPSLAFAQVTSPTLEKIAKASLEDLMNMTVTTVSRIPEQFRKTTSPLFIITAEDIRRSGVTSIPEALRMAPGVNVARLDANKWAISIRGFNARGANKLLVLIDGRSIYDPLFSGTIWEFRDVMIEDVDRIEIIRGPGGSTWEANAVNGVINIITKRSSATQGGLVTGGGGKEEKAFGSVRYGGKISEDTYYRIYSKYFDRDAGYSPTHASDDSRHGQAGFRLDSRLAEKQDLNIMGTVFDGSYEAVEGLGSTVGARGGALQGRWSLKHSSESDLSVNAFVETFDLDNVGIREDRTTSEINIQEQDKLTDWFTLVSGFQYRFTTDKVDGSEGFFVEPRERDDNLIGLRLAGMFSLLDNRVHVKLGSKLERNDYSDYEFQPDIGASWIINDTNTLWANISRAVRTPSRIENDFVVVVPPPVSLTFRGNSALESENLVAYQAGTRTLLSKEVMLTTALFYHDYSDIVVTEGTTFTNSAEANAYGAEASLRWEIEKWWEILGSYGYIRPDLQISDDISAMPPEVSDLEGNTPSNQFYLRSSFDLNSRWEFDAGLRYVDSLSMPKTSDYTVADFRLAYKISPSTEIALIGQNLFDRHYEFGDSSKVEERVFAKLTWIFE